MKAVLITLIKFYQKTISPSLPSSCRFYPTCSHYSIDAIKIHGVFKGSWLAMSRIIRCNPFNPGGYDPVPGKHKHVHFHIETKYDLTNFYDIL